MNEDDLRHTTLRQLKRVIWLISEHYYFVALWPESSLTFLVDNKILLLSEDEISLKTYFGMIHYLENKVGVVDFANVQGMVMF